MNKHSLLLGFLAVLLTLTGCMQPSNTANNQNPGAAPSGELIIFHAGSMSVPIKEIADSFMKTYPAVKVLTEAAGSRECARKISDIGKPCDIMVSSDYKVIDEMLIPKYSAFNIAFATNEMVIAYLPENEAAKTINPDNWIDILLQPRVAYGRSDPNSDPCGYRSLMVMQLAEKYLDRKGIAERLAAKDKRYIRPKEVDLLALLESNSIDFIFIYKSVACQHKLGYLSLPAEINLGDANKDSIYQQAQVKISGSTPSSQTLMRGETMIYGITMLKNAQNPTAALAFMKFFLAKDKGAAIIERNGQPSIIPYPSTTYNHIPEELKSFVLPL
jgi:molybdate/tungstate transport system substrate-binding protein